MNQCPECESQLDDPSFCPCCHLYFSTGIIEQLWSSDVAVRRAAAHNAILTDRNPVLIARLAEALFDTDSDVRKSAGVALFVAGAAASSVIPQLIEALEHEDIRVRRLAAASLSNLGADAKTALPKLSEMSRSPDGLAKTWASKAIANIDAELSASI